MTGKLLIAAALTTASMIVSAPAASAQSYGSVTLSFGSRSYDPYAYWYDGYSCDPYGQGRVYHYYGQRPSYGYYGRQDYGWNARALQLEHWRQEQARRAYWEQERQERALGREYDDDDGY